MSLPNTKEQKWQIMIDRINQLTEHELLFYKKMGRYSDMTLYEQRHESCEPIQEGHIHWLWQCTVLGENYTSPEKAECEERFENLEKTIKILELVEDRKPWGSIMGLTYFDYFHNKGVATPFMLRLVIRKLYESDRNMFDSYEHEPLFKVGEIVQLRNNAAADSVLSPKTSYNGVDIIYYGCGKTKLKEAMKKTFMIIEQSPHIEGSCRVTSYKYKKGQGGSRYYKVLPMGEQKTYYVAEKFLKKCRTKAVKDAGKK